MTDRFSGYTPEDFRNYAIINYKPRNTKLLFGKGINDAGYMVQIEDLDLKRRTGQRKVLWRCEVYQHWMSMIRRCYSTTQKGRDRFLNSTVCNDWLYFSNFKRWYDREVVKFCKEGAKVVLDKDLKILGNELYSPETCLLLPLNVNSSISLKGQGKYLLGVSWKKKNRQYQCQILENGKKRYLGLFNSEMKAHNRWLVEKAYCILEIPLAEGLEDYVYPHLVNMSLFLHHCAKNNIKVRYEDLGSLYKVYQEDVSTVCDTVFSEKVEKLHQLLTESIKEGDTKRVRKYSLQIEKLYKKRSSVEKGYGG